MSIRALSGSLLLLCALVLAPAGGVGLGAAGNATTLSIDSAVAFDDADGQFAGTHSIEVRFSKPVNRSTLDPIEVAVVLANGTTVTPTAVLAGATDDDRQVVLDVGATALGSISAVRVVDGASFRTAGGDTVSGSTVADRTVVVTTTTLTEGDGNPDRVPFMGETVAFVGDEAGEGITIKRRDGSDLLISREIAGDGQVYVLRTGRLDASAEYVALFDGDGVAPDLENDQDDDGDGSTDEDRLLRFDVLTLEIRPTENRDVDDATVTTHDNLTGTVSSNVAGREVSLVLVRPAEKGNLTRSLTLDGDGEAVFDFGVQADIEEADVYYELVATDAETGIEARVDVKVSEVDDEAAFEGPDVVTDQRGDVVNITVQMSPTLDDRVAVDNATVTVGSAAVGYRANLTLHDGDNDHEVVLRWNTYAADGPGGNAEFEVVRDGSGRSDTVTVDDIDTAVAGGPDDVLDADVYELSVRAGAAASAEPAQDTALVSLDERSTEALTVYTAPGAFEGEIDSPSEFDARVDRGAVVADDTVAIGDLLLVEIEASGLQGAIENSSGTTATGRLFEVLEDEASLTVGERRAGGSNRIPRLLDVRNASSSTVVADAPADRYLVIVDTDAVPVVLDADGDGGVSAADEPTRLADGMHTVANFTVPETAGGLADRTESVTADLAFQDPAATVSVPGGGDLSLEPEAGQTVGGTTTVAAGSELRIVVRAAGDETVLLVEEATVVRAASGQNEWAATFDLADVGPGTPIEVDVTRDFETLLDAPVDGRVLGPPTASIEVADQSVAGDVVVVSAVRLSRGGFVGIHLGSATGRLLGVGPYLPRGSHDGVRVLLDEGVAVEETTVVAVPYRDPNGNRRFDPAGPDTPYLDGRDPVADGARLTVRTPERHTTVRTVEVTRSGPIRTGTRFVTETVARTVVRTVVVDRRPGGTTTGTPGMPGFTPAMAVVALALAVAAAIRRRGED